MGWKRDDRGDGAGQTELDAAQRRRAGGDGLLLEAEFGQDGSAARHESLTAGLVARETRPIEDDDSLPSARREEGGDESPGLLAHHWLAAQDEEKAIDVLAELSEIAKQVELELAKARREAEADSP